MTGFSTNASPNHDMTIWRYNTNGTLDGTFNSVGYLVHNEAAGGSGADYGYGIAIEAVGNIVVSGDSLNAAANEDMVVWRYKSDGTLDGTFNTSGFVPHHNAGGGDGAEIGRALTIDGNGRIVVTGYGQNVSLDYDMAIWRYE